MKREEKPVAKEPPTKAKKSKGKDVFFKRGQPGPEKEKA